MFAPLMLCDNIWWEGLSGLSTNKVLPMIYMTCKDLLQDVCLRPQFQYELYDPSSPTTLYTIDDNKANQH